MKLIQILLLVMSTAYVTAVSALPALQIGPGDSTPGGAWNYDSGTQTWVATGSNSFELSVFANCESGVTGCTPNGSFAWDSAGASNRYAYLTVASLPDLGDLNIDQFDISISDTTLVATGYGAPPIEDPNGLASHSVFDTYFEIYEFQFDGSIETITNTQPGDSGSGDGYSESFNITLNSMVDGVTGVHFDLFTTEGERWTPGGPDDKKLVEAFAPFSHDAEWTGDTPPPPPPTSVSEPGTLILLAIGLLGLVRVRRKV